MRPAERKVEPSKDAAAPVKANREASGDRQIWLFERFRGTQGTEVSMPTKSNFLVASTVAPTIVYYGYRENATDILRNDGQGHRGFPAVGRAPVSLNWKTARSTRRAWAHRRLGRRKAPRRRWPGRTIGFFALPSLKQFAPSPSHSTKRTGVTTTRWRFHRMASSWPWAGASRRRG